MGTNGKAHVHSIPELAKALGRTFQHLYMLEKEGRFQKTANGYHVERIKRALAKRVGIFGDKEEAAKWDSEYKKWRARTARMEYAEARGLLTNKGQAIKETIRREAAIVSGLRQLQFALPPKLHNMPYEEWPALIDQAATEVLEGVVKRISH